MLNYLRLQHCGKGKILKEKCTEGRGHSLEQGKKNNCRSPLSEVKGVQVTLAQTARHWSAGALYYAKFHHINTRTPCYMGTSVV